MSAQHEPARAPLPPDAPSMGARRHRDAKPTVADFPVGRRFVAERVEPNGFRTYLHCQVADAYEDAQLCNWNENRVCLYAIVGAVSERKHAGLVGHLVTVALDSGGYVWRGVVRLTLLKSADVAWVSP